MSGKQTKKANKIYRKAANKLLTGRYNAYCENQDRHIRFLRRLCFILMGLIVGLTAGLIGIIIKWG